MVGKINVTTEKIVFNLSFSGQEKSIHFLPKQKYG